MAHTKPPTGSTPQVASGAVLDTRWSSWQWQCMKRSRCPRHLMLSMAQQSRKLVLKNVPCYTALQTQENHQWSQISWRLKCPLAQRHWWQQMEAVHSAALSPDADLLGARKARKCTGNGILPQHCYMDSICSGIAQDPHSHMEAELPSSFISKLWLCLSKPVTKGWDWGGQAQHGNRLSVRCARTVATGTTGDLK